MSHLVLCATDVGSIIIYAMKENGMEYTKEKFDQMIKEISGHKDFGKRNPVDIGIECGYLEEDITGLMKMIEGDIANDCTSDLQNKYFFFIRKEEGAFLVSVDVPAWNVKVIKQIEEYEADDRYDIKKNIFVRTSGIARKILLWENFDTGETKKWLSDESIERILILDSGILIAFPKELVIWDGKTIVARKPFPRYFDSSTFWINIGQEIYLYDKFYNSMYVIDQKLESEFREYDIELPTTSEVVTLGPEIHELGEDTGKLFGFGYYQKYGSGIFNTNKVYRDFPIKFGADGTTSFPFSRSVLEHPDGVIRDFVTNDYILLGIEIYSRRQIKADSWCTEPVCMFNRNIYRKQVIADYKNNIFIGLDDNDDIIKIDLENEREATVIPVQVV